MTPLSLGIILEIENEENPVTTEELLKQLKSLKNELRNRFGIEEIALFGSYARKEATPHSDVDLVILKIEKKEFSKRVQAIEYLEQKLHKKIDLGYYDSMRSFIKKRIEKDLIYV